MDLVLLTIGGLILVFFLVGLVFTTFLGWTWKRYFRECLELLNPF
jgi:hypothetical protein